MTAAGTSSTGLPTARAPTPTVVGRRGWTSASDETMSGPGARRPDVRDGGLDDDEGEPGTEPSVRAGSDGQVAPREVGRPSSTSGKKLVSTSTAPGRGAAHDLVGGEGGDVVRAEEVRVGADRGTRHLEPERDRLAWVHGPRARIDCRRVADESPTQVGQEVQVGRSPRHLRGRAVWAGTTRNRARSELSAATRRSAPRPRRRRQAHRPPHVGEGRPGPRARGGLHERVGSGRTANVVAGARGAGAAAATWTGLT